MRARHIFIALLVALLFTSIPVFSVVPLHAQEGREQLIEQMQEFKEQSASLLQMYNSANPEARAMMDKHAQSIAANLIEQYQSLPDT